MDSLSTSFDTIYFPAITICNMNFMQRSVLEKYDLQVSEPVLVAGVGNLNRKPRGIISLKKSKIDTQRLSSDFLFIGTEPMINAPTAAAACGYCMALLCPSSPGGPLSHTRETMGSRKAADIQSICLRALPASFHTTPSHRTHPASCGPSGSGLDDEWAHDDKSKL